MKIVYAGESKAGSSSLYRRWTLERLGHEVIAFEPGRYEVKNPTLHALAFRMATGPHATRMNRDLLKVVHDEKPDVLWVDKVLLLTPRTVRLVREMSVATVSYMIDNAFGPRHDPGWRMYVKTVPEFDLHVTQRDVSVEHYLQRGARNVMKVQTAYEPTVHFPPPEPIKDEGRTREVSFIGTPYDERAATLLRVDEAGFRVSINGAPSVWKDALGQSAFEKMHGMAELYGDEYRTAIWASKINLSFLTHSNQDEYAHKSFEIAGCEGFLLAERSAGHMEKFEEDIEAVFFSGPEELVEKIKRYLPDEDARRRIAAAGHKRAVRDGYCNDVQVQRILDRVEQIARGGKLHGG